MSPRGWRVQKSSRGMRRLAPIVHRFGRPSHKSERPWLVHAQIVARHCTRAKIRCAPQVLRVSEMRRFRPPRHVGCPCSTPEQGGHGSQQCDSVDRRPSACRLLRVCGNRLGVRGARRGPVPARLSWSRGAVRGARMPVGLVPQSGVGLTGPRQRGHHVTLTAAARTTA